MIASPLLMGLVLLIDPSSSNVEWSGGVAVELRGGHAPLVPGQPSEPALRLSVAPTAVMLYQSRARSRELWIEYTPQAYLRVSRMQYEQSDVRRPLTFHDLRSRYVSRFSETLSWQGVLGGSIGESDYTLQAAQLGGNPAAGADGSDGGAPSGGIQGTLIDEPIVTTGGASASVGLTVRPHPLHSLTLGPSATVRRLLSNVDTASLVGLNYEQTSADLSLSHGFIASRVDSLESTVTGGYADFGAQRGSQAYAAGSLAWLRRLRPRLDSELTGGAFYTVQVVQPTRGNEIPTGLPVIPTVDYLLSGRVLQRARLRISANVNAGTRAYFDAVQGSVLPLAGGGLRLDFEHPPDLGVGLSASFYTPPTQPRGFEASNPAVGRSSLSIRTPVTYRISRNLSMEFGTIFTGRGPHLSLVDSRGPFPQTEFWVYVSFRAFYST